MLEAANSEGAGHADQRVRLDHLTQPKRDPDAVGRVAGPVVGVPGLAKTFWFQFFGTSFF